MKNGIAFDTGALIALERRGQRAEPLSEILAKVAGEALAPIKGATSVDAIVMASAAQRGDLVYTADVSDLTKLAGYFRAVRVLSIG